MTTSTSGARAPAPARPNNWGRWGDNDQRGVLNEVTPERVVAAAASVKKGIVYGLGTPIQNHDMPTFEHRGSPMRLTLQDGTDEGTYAPELGCAPGTGANEDVIVMASHNATHMDALIHFYSEGSHYNGVDKSAMQAMAGATKLGIDKVGAVAARAVIFDMVSYYRHNEAWVNPGQQIGADDLQSAARQQGVELRRGDIALIRTGYLQYWWDNRPGPEDYMQPGLGVDAALWLASLDTPVVGSDNAAVEVIPWDGGEFMVGHKVLLVDHGIHLVEYLDLSAPAHDRNFEGLLALGPLKVTGATGSPVNPVFIV